jgi:outer membrane protein OmpA-like peptidoglycan-associated protein
MSKFMRLYKIAPILLFMLSALFALNNGLAQSPNTIDFNAPLNKETFDKWNEFIEKNAPSQSALDIVIHLANRHSYSGRAIVAREVLTMYKKYFPLMTDWFNSQIDYLGEVALTQTPQSDMLYLYDKFVQDKAPSESAFLAMQRISDSLIINKNWDSAIKIYNYYKPLFPNYQARIDKITSILSDPEQGLSVNNLGPNINSAFDEWDPNPTPDGKFLYFSAKSKIPCYGESDVYVSALDSNDKWSAAQNIGRTVNGENDETIDNVSADGSTLLLSGNFPGTFGMFDIYTAKKSKEGWSSLSHLPKPINSEYTDEGAQTSGDGKAIIFSSDRPGGIGKFAKYSELYHGGVMGNMDLYVCLKTEKGWSQPINLGPKINTEFAERAPYLHPDGKTLYFSSDGHAGLGRLDLFKATRLSDTSWTEWSEPINLGKEINGASDDWGYRVAIGGDSAFFAAYNRPSGYGSWDIYSISLPQNAKPQLVATIRGKTLNKKGEPIQAAIKWEDLETGAEIGELTSDPQTGEYFIALPLGKNYGYYAQKKGYYPSSDNVNLKSTSASLIVKKDIVLISEYEIEDQKASFIIKNIFFDYKSYELKKESYPELERLCEFLRQYPDKSFIITGHCDAVGSDAYNLDLSEKRAQALKTYLVQHGFLANKLKCIGKGSKLPVASNETENGRAENRRVEISFE